MNYRKKDVVWVKISRYPWWPAEVLKVDKKEKEKGTQTTVSVKFFNEDYINPITSKSRIKPFMCKEKEKFIETGLKEEQNSDLFKQALDLASMQFKTEDTRDRILGTRAIRNKCFLEHHNGSVNCDDSNSCDKSVGGHSPYLFNYHAFKSARLKTQVNWNEQIDDQYSSQESKSTQSDEISEQQNKVPCARSDQDKGSKENSKNLYKKRKLTFEDKYTKKLKQIQENVTTKVNSSSDLPSLSRTSTPKIATKKLSSKLNIVKTYTKLSQKKENLNQKCGHKEYAKEKDSKTNVISESESAMTPKTLKWEESFELPTPTLSRTAALSYDPNLDKDECDSSSDSDTELPEGLSPIAFTRGEQTIHEKDIVWLKVRTLHVPAWPAFVRKVYKKKKKVHKLSAVFIEGCYNMPKRYRVTYKPKNVVPFFDKQKLKFMEEGEALSDPAKRKCFKEACEKAESFLHQKALSTLNKAEFSFFNFINSDDEEEVGSDTSEVIPLVVPDSTTISDVEERLNDAEDGRESNMSEEEFYRSQEPSAKELKRKMKMTEKQENLVNFIKTDDMKKYLFDIFYEKKKSDRHRKYFYGTVKEQNSLKYAGFGPIYSEEQEEEIVETTKDWLFEIPPSKRPSITYILDVWIPEAVVYAMTKVKTYGRKKAWEQFWKGTRTTKEERDRQHQSLLDFRGYTEEEIAEIKQKSDERLKTKLYQLGIGS